MDVFSASGIQPSSNEENIKRRSYLPCNDIPKIKKTPEIYLLINHKTYRTVHVLVT